MNQITPFNSHNINHMAFKIKKEYFHLKQVSIKLKLPSISMKVHFLNQTEKIK